MIDAIEISCIVFAQALAPSLHHDRCDRDIVHRVRGDVGPVAELAPLHHDRCDSDIVHRGCSGVNVISSFIIRSGAVHCCTAVLRARGLLQ